MPNNSGPKFEQVDQSVVLQNKDTEVTGRKVDYWRKNNLKLGLDDSILVSRSDEVFSWESQAKEIASPAHIWLAINSRLQ